MLWQIDNIKYAKTKQGQLKIKETQSPVEKSARKKASSNVTCDNDDKAEGTKEVIGGEPLEVLEYEPLEVWGDEPLEKEPQEVSDKEQQVVSDEELQDGKACSRWCTWRNQWRWRGSSQLKLQRKQAMQQPSKPEEERARHQRKRVQPARYAHELAW